MQKVSETNIYLSRYQNDQYLEASLLCKHYHPIRFSLYCPLDCEMWLRIITTFLSFIAGACSGLKVTVPSHTVHGIRGQALYLPVHYGFHTPASDIQIIWLFERPHTMPKYLLGSVNKSVVPDLEYQHKFTMMPPNASLLINPLQFTDEGNYIVKVNIQGNGTLSASQKIQVTVDGESTISDLGHWGTWQLVTAQEIRLPGLQVLALQLWAD